MQIQSIEGEIEGELNASLWVHQNVIKLSKQFELDFQGCEKEAMAMFMKIDKRRHVKRVKIAKSSVAAIPERRACKN